MPKPKVNITDKSKFFPLTETLSWMDEYLDSGMEVGDFVKMMQNQKERNDKRRYEQEQSKLKKIIDNEKI